MTQVCPIGFFCFDQNTIVLLFTAFVISTVYVINKNHSQFSILQNDLQQSKQTLEQKITQANSMARQVVDETDYQLQKDMMRVTNPLMPPERSYPYRISRGGTAINIPTRGYPTGYQQVGILAEEHESPNKKILPLFGEQTYPGSNQWRYYSGTDGFQSIKLPVYHKGRNCQDEYGCDEIYNGNQVKIEALPQHFNASIYKLDAPRYLPHIL